jgi:hypothetical protein
MPASPTVTSRMNSMREKLQKSKAGAAEGLARFAAAEPAADNDITLPSTSLRAMLVRVKMGQEKTLIPRLIGIDNSKIPQTV